MAKIFNIQGSPFAKLSAEEEKSYIRDIFYKQQYYDSLVDLAEASASRFILGQRGQGKSATILHLFEDVKELGVMPILIDHYKGFPLQNNENYFLFSMIQSMTFNIAKHLLENPRDHKKLGSFQKEQIAFFIEAFYDPNSAEECIICAKNIRTKKNWNRLYNFLNNHLKFLNNIISVGVKVGTDLIKSYAGVDVDFSTIAGEYIQEFNLKTFNKLEMSEVVKWDTTKLINIIHILRDIVIKLEYKSIVIMFDKIDEVSDINADIEKVSDFMYELLTDNSLLYTDRVAIVVSLWSEVKKELNKKGVRFDKFKEVDIRWRNDELEMLLNKRLRYFSINKDIEVSLYTLVPNKQDRDMILELSDHSPRALLNLFGYILDEECDKNDIKVFSNEAINKGANMYCKKFDYVSAKPSRIGKANDLPTWITKLLRLKHTEFTLDQYKSFFNLRKSGAKHIETLVKYNLIRDTMYPTDNDEPLYEIADPRIKYMIKRGIQNLDD